jgi:hypothetical protein
MIENIGMRVHHTFYGAGFMDLPFAPCTLPSLLITDKPPHTGNRGPTFEIILQGAGSLAAESMLMSRAEVRSFATTMGTGITGEPFLLFGCILAVFTHYHNPILSPCPVTLHYASGVQVQIKRRRTA